MIAAGDAFRPAAPARLTALAFIAAAHVLLLCAIALAGGTVAMIREAKPLFVRFVAPQAPPPAPAVARVPLPAMRAPQIRLPDAPVIEAAITVPREERPAPPSDARQATLPAEAPRPAPAAAQPPRFDLAYLDNPAPAYPPISRKLREEGRVVLRVLVNAAGLVDDIEIVATSGHARLDDAARAAVRRWKFLPGRAGEQAVAGWALVPVAFNLQG